MLCCWGNSSPCLEDNPSIPDVGNYFPEDSQCLLPEDLRQLNDCVNTIIRESGFVIGNALVGQGVIGWGRENLRLTFVCTFSVTVSFYSECKFSYFKKILVIFKNYFVYNCLGFLYTVGKESLIWRKGPSVSL